MRLSLSDIFTVIVLWSENMQVKDIISYYGISRKSVMGIFHRLRSLVCNDLTVDPIRLGGRGIICQIDETLLVHKAKHHVGRFPRNQIWAFGIVDTSYSPAKGYVQIVSNRTRDTLLPIITRICKPGTIIHSDSWAAYSDLQNNLGFAHQQVNHRYNFVDPTTGGHTQHIESYWCRLKSRIKMMKGVVKEELPFVVGEFVWKDNKRKSAFTHLIGLLRAKN